MSIVLVLYSLSESHSLFKRISWERSLLPRACVFAQMPLHSIFVIQDTCLFGLFQLAEPPRNHSPFTSESQLLSESYLYIMNPASCQQSFFCRDTVESWLVGVNFYAHTDTTTTDVKVNKRGSLRAVCRIEHHNTLTLTLPLKGKSRRKSWTLLTKKSYKRKVFSVLAKIPPCLLSLVESLSKLTNLLK